MARFSASTVHCASLVLDTANVVIDGMTEVESGVAGETPALRFENDDGVYIVADRLGQVEDEAAGDA